jgi:hypothetical protein
MRGGGRMREGWRGRQREGKGEGKVVSIKATTQAPSHCSVVVIRVHLEEHNLE